MHEECEALDKHASDLTSSVLAQCFCSALFKLDTMGFKENISSAHQFYCFIILVWQQLNVFFVLFWHMPFHLYLQIIIYITSFNILCNSCRLLHDLKYVFV